MIGGDCTITLGVVAGIMRVPPRVGLVHFDGDADLGMPGQGSRILHAMGIAHLLGLSRTPLSALFPTSPPLPDERLALVGYDESDPDTYRSEVFAARPGLVHFPDRAVRSDPVGCAGAALEAVEAGSDAVVVHFDVDAVDPGDLPLASYPHYDTGVTLSVAEVVLRVLLASTKLAAVVLTEVNPSHDPSGESLSRYVDAVTAALLAGSQHG